MSEVLRLRCSSLPIAFRCGGSVRPGDLAINDTSDLAELGTAAHAGLAGLVDTGRLDWDGVPELAKGHGFNEKELRMLLSDGAKLWEAVKDSFPDARSEVAFEHQGDGYVLTGHVDVLARSGYTARLADWKGGRLDASYKEQLHGYAALALFDDPSLDDAEGGILWVRDGDFEPYALRRNQLPAWEERLISEVVRWDGTYRPGPHCSHCKRRHECPAANALARYDVAAIANVDLEQAALDRMTPQQKVFLVVQARDVEKKAQRAIALIRQDVKDHGDVVGEEQRLTLQEEERRVVDVLKAFPILAEGHGFGDEEMAQILSMSISEAESIVAKRAGKGNGAKAVRELRAQLTAADAVKTETVSKMVVRRL